MSVIEMTHRETAAVMVVSVIVVGILGGTYVLAKKIMNS